MDCMLFTFGKKSSAHALGGVSGVASSLRVYYFSTIAIWAIQIDIHNVYGEKKKWDVTFGTSYMNIYRYCFQEDNFIRFTLLSYY